MTLTSDLHNHDKSLLYRYCFALPLYCSAARHWGALMHLQASFRKASAVPALSKLVGLGPGNAAAGAAARALLVLAYDYEKLQHWL